MVTLRISITQPIFTCLFHLFTESNVVQETRFYKTESFFEKELQAKHATVRS